MVGKYMVVSFMFMLSFVTLARDVDSGANGIRSVIWKEYSKRISERLRTKAETWPAVYCAEENEDMLVSGRIKIRAEDVNVSCVSCGVTNEYCFSNSIEEDVVRCSVVTARTDVVRCSKRCPSGDRIGPISEVDFTIDWCEGADDVPICTIGTNNVYIIKESHTEIGEGRLFCRYMCYDKAKD